MSLPKAQWGFRAGVFLLLTFPWGLLQQPSWIPNALVKSKIQRWKVKEKEQDESLMLSPGPGQQGPRMSVDIHSGSFMPDKILKPLSWAAGSKQMYVPISQDGWDFGLHMTLKALFWMLLAGSLLELSAWCIALIQFLAAASALKQGQGSEVSFRAQNLECQNLAPAFISLVAWVGEESGAHKALLLQLSFSWAETRVWKARNCSSVPRGLFKAV